MIDGRSKKDYRLLDGSILEKGGNFKGEFRRERFIAPLHWVDDPFRTETNRPLHPLRGVRTKGVPCRLHALFEQDYIGEGTNTSWCRR